MDDPQNRPPDEHIGVLVHRLSEQIPELVRGELRLAQAELAQKGRKAGLGVGLFSAAGLLALFGVGTLIATAILGLALVLPAWLAALVVAVMLLGAAGLVAVGGSKEVHQATPAAPERAVAGIREDVATVKGAHR
jgi:hypothetical protein